MDIDLNSWLNLLLRWFHVILGITWIGQTYLFNWLERRMEAPLGDGQDNISGQVWMVHSGGFFKVEKQARPAIMPQKLHWFKWEAALTWISGMLLLALVYYAGGLMLDYDSELSNAAAIGLSLGILVGGWILYDLALRLALMDNDLLVAAVAWLAVLVLAWAMQDLFSSRAVYMQVGALFGTVMAANVWLRILPAQTQMLAATQAGLAPDMALGARAKRASKHNTYMSVPLIFIMIGSHYPTIAYGSDASLAVLGGLILVGWAGAKIMRG